MFCVTTTLTSLDILLHCITTFHPFPATNMCKIQFSYIALAWYAKSAKISYVICQPVVLFCARMTPFIMKTGLSVKLTLAAEKLMTQRTLLLTALTDQPPRLSLDLAGVSQVFWSLGTEALRGE